MAAAESRAPRIEPTVSSGLTGVSESGWACTDEESLDAEMLWQYADTRWKTQNARRRDLRMEANWLDQRSSVAEVVKVR
jgi:hypothetical protein